MTRNRPGSLANCKFVELGFVQPREQIWLGQSLDRGADVITRELQRRVDLEKVPGVVDGLGLTRGSSGA